MLTKYSTFCLFRIFTALVSGNEAKVDHIVVNMSATLLFKNVLTSINVTTATEASVISMLATTQAKYACATAALLRIFSYIILVILLVVCCIL